MAAKSILTPSKLNSSNFQTRIGELKDKLLSPKGQSGSASPNLKPSSKRMRQFSPGADDDEDLELPEDIDPSVLRTFNYLFDTKIAEAIQPYKDIIDELRDVIAEKDDRIRALEAELAAKSQSSDSSGPTASGSQSDKHCVSQELSEIYKRMDDQEQRGRKKNLRLFGVPSSENTDELICSIAKSIGVELGSRDIHISHFLDSDKSKKRQLIVEFAHPKDKLSLLTNRKKLRDPNNEFHDVFINEDLTRPRYLLLRALQAKRKEQRIHTAWSFRGKIFYKLTDSKDERPILVKNPLSFDVNSV